MNDMALDHAALVTDTEVPASSTQGHVMGYQPGPFDYGALLADVAAAAAKSAERIKSTLRKGIVEIGRELLETKEALGHGHFTNWIERELNFSPTTARNYMRAAEAFGDKPATVAVLTPATLYIDANAPVEVKAEIERRVEAGEGVNRDTVAEMIRKQKEADVEAKRLAGMTEDQRKRDAATKKRQRTSREEQQRRFEAEWEEVKHRRIEAADEAIAILRGYDMDDDAILSLHKALSLGGGFLKQRLAPTPNSSAT